MPRYRLIIEYDGSPFAGWQEQPGLETVQGVLQEAAFRLTQERVTFAGAGRTDRGVHALGQVAHIDLHKEIPLDALRRGLNFYLKDKSVVVLSAASAPETFHARFSAMARCYRYLLIDRPSPSVLWKGRAWWVNRTLDIEAMQEGSAHLIGHHDFSRFRCSACQDPSPLKTLDRLSVVREGEHVVIEAQARSFLHRQVRFMTSALVEVGLRRHRPAHLLDLLDLQRNMSKPAAAPACGLYFLRVLYPAE